jgi:SAM-dependent methyltransferase
LIVNGRAPMEDARANLGWLDASPTAIARDADYAVQVFQAYRDQAGGVGAAIEGRRLLELGPGTGYAPALAISAAATVTISDRWLSPWRRTYHPKLYAAVADRLRAKGFAAEADVLAEAAKGEGHAPRLSMAESPAEALPLGDGAFDLVFSNAVLEHLFDHAKAAAELFRVTAPGGWNFHQVDYRDHRSFDRPLEYLLLSAEAYQPIAEAGYHGLGCQVRMGEHIALFEAAGFRLHGAHPNTFAEPDYLDAFLARAAKKPEAYAHGMGREMLSVIGALLIFQKPQ